MAKKHIKLPKSDEDPPTQERSVEEALADSNADDAIASLEQNKLRIFVLVVLITVAVCGYLVWKQLNAAKHSDASQAFSAAQTTRDTDALDKVVADFPGSVSAGNALLTKADVQLDRGKPEDAKATFEAFVFRFQSHPRLAQGLFGIANIQHVAGDVEGAKSFYEQVLAKQPDGDLSPLARIRLGDLALEGGDAEGAELLYSESISKHPGNPFVDKAQRKIAMAKIGDPPVVKRPAPKPLPKPEPKKAVPKAPAKVEPKAKPPVKAPAPKKAAAPKAKTPAPKAKTPAPAPKAKTPAPKG